MSETPNQPQTEALEVVLLNKLIEVCSVWRQDGQLKITVTMLQGDLSKGSRYKKQYEMPRIEMPLEGSTIILALPPAELSTNTFIVTQQPPVFKHDHKNKISLLVCVNS